jgi:methylated-DNA-[protein]-cysteine S-methyltransferase
LARFIRGDGQRNKQEDKFYMGQELFYTILKTSPGWIGLLGSDAGLRRVILPQPTDVKAVSLLLENIPAAVPSSSYFHDLIKRLQAYFSGQVMNFPDKLDFGDATPFQRNIWEATRKIPYGKTHTYTWVAEQAGKPKAVRAAGQALGQNPLPIIVPCHRVTSTGGGLGGFSGGLTTKKYLLKLENNRHQDRQLVLEIA